MLGIYSSVQTVSSIHEKSRGRSSCAAWEHRVSIQRRDNKQVSPGLQNHCHTKELPHESKPHSQQRLKTSSTQTRRFSALSSEVSVSQRGVLESQASSLVVFPRDLSCFQSPTNKAATKDHSGHKVLQGTHQTQRGGLRT